MPELQPRVNELEIKTEWKNQTNPCSKQRKRDNECVSGVLLTSKNVNHQIIR